MTDFVAWAVASAVVAGILTAGAWVWERAARWWGRAARWGWLAALTGSVLLPVAVRWLPERAWPDVPVGLVPLEALTVTASAPAAAGPRLTLDEVALAGWIVLSLCVLGYVALVVVRLARAQRNWREAEVDGARVLVSRNVGPAALGVRRGVVVIPTWALQLDAELRRLMLVHEREHVGAGDPRLLLCAVGLVVLMPWNPFMWLQLVRLRNAIELDCDVRVLRAGADPASYGSLLLEVGMRRGRAPLMLATFAEPRLLLEERIRRIARWPLERRPVRATLLTALALALFSTALFARVQSSALPVLPAESVRDVREALGLVNEARLPIPPLASDTPPVVPVQRPDPRQTPYARAPELRDTDAVLERLRANYPPVLRDAGIGGTATVWLLVNDRGAVQALQLSKPSGYPALDQAALHVASSFEFEPAEDAAGRPTRAWIEVPIAFNPVASSVTISQQPLREQQPPAATAAGDDISQRPTFTPMTQRPELRNPTDVQRALVRNYPPLLRDAGIGGTTVIWFYIDEQGTVGRTQVSKPSGYPALDDAALSVAADMQFSPALNRDRVTPVWIEIPIVFTARDASPERLRVSAVAVEGRRGESAVVVPRAGGQERTALETRARTAAAPPERDLTVQPRPAVVEREVEARAGTPTGPPGTAALTQQPQLTNAADVQRALVRNYPPVLRDAGIGGTVHVWLYVDEQGRVLRMQLSKSSGYPALDEAGLRVAGTLQFAPARRGDEAVAAWTEVPFSFTAR